MDGIFKTIIGSRGYHVYRFTTWKHIKKDESCTFAFEKRREALDIDPYSIAICIFPRDRVAPVTVGHVPRELSRVFYFFMKRGGKVSGRVYSTRYVRSPIPEGLEVPVEVTFTCEDVMKNSAKLNL